MPRAARRFLPPIFKAFWPVPAVRASFVAIILIAIGAFSLSRQAWGAHAYAQFGDIKYAEGFRHFAYVNPDAPKGGEIRLVPPTRPTNYDKFNPFTLKGTPPHNLAGLLLETLLTGNAEEPTTAYGLLADDVTVAPDGRSATFRLHPQARFHNGDAVLAEDVAIEVYDLRGARVRTLTRGRLEAGRHSATWDGRDEAGHRAPAGVYLVRMSAGAYHGQQKLVRVE